LLERSKLTVSAPASAATTLNEQVWEMDAFVSGSNARASENAIADRAAGQGLVDLAPACDILRPGMRARRDPSRIGGG